MNLVALVGGTANLAAERSAASSSLMDRADDEGRSRVAARGARHACAGWTTNRHGAALAGIRLAPSDVQLAA